MTQKDEEMNSIAPVGPPGGSTTTGLSADEPGQVSQSAVGQATAKESTHEYERQPGAPGSGISSHGQLNYAVGDGLPGEEQPPPISGKTRLRGRWTVISIACAVLLTLLSVAGIILVTRPRATIDQLLILTVPSGADVTFDGRALGPSPVKLEGVRMGTHKVVVAKDGYQELQYDESITDSRTLDYKLKLLPPPGAEGLPAEQALNQYKQNMEDAFARGDYAVPYYGKSALYFAHLILDLDSTNPSALDMKDRVRNALVQAAQTAITRVDLAQAQELVSTLGQYFPTDEDARAAAAKLEAQIAIHRSDVRDLLRKAEDALRAGNLIDPPRASAYYYSKQALTLDRQNQHARAIKTQVRDGLLQSIEQTAIVGNMAQATREVEQALKLFPEDSQLQAKQKDLELRQAADARANDPKERRNRGLKNFRQGNYAESIEDLEFDAQQDHPTPEVLFSLGYSYKKLRNFDKAMDYLRKVRTSSEDTYVSAQAAQGEIEAERGNITAAAEHFKKARDLGGSPMYPRADLEDRIDKLENKEARRSVVEPTPLTVQVRHLHGGLLHGSCSGTLTVNNAGVRYDSTDHVFAANLVHAGVRISKGEMAVQFQDKNEKFKPVRSGDDERFREAVSRYHSAESGAK